MAGKISDKHLNYFMGHKPNATLAHTTYQVPDHQVNNSGLRFDESQDTSIGDYHSSVACGRDNNSLNVPDHVLYSSSTMSILIKAFKKADTKVFNQFHKSSMDLEVGSYAISWCTIISNVLFSPQTTPWLKRHGKLGLISCIYMRTCQQECV
jgi:hypothetical protein